MPTNVSKSASPPTVWYGSEIAEPHVEVERGRRAGVVHARVDPVDDLATGFSIWSFGGGPPLRLKPFFGESTQMSGLIHGMNSPSIVSPRVMNTL